MPYVWKFWIHKAADVSGFWCSTCIHLADKSHYWGPRGCFPIVSHLPLSPTGINTPRRFLSLDMTLLMKCIMITRPSPGGWDLSFSFFCFFFFLSPGGGEGEGAEAGVEVFEIWTVIKKQASVTLDRNRIGHVYFRVFIDFFFFVVHIVQLQLKLTNLTQIAPYRGEYDRGVFQSS